MNKQSLIALPILIFILLITTYISNIDFNNLGLTSAVFFQNSIETEDVIESYEDDEVKIMIVPGHDNDNPGAVYFDVKEADINLDVANYLADFLDDNDRFDVHLSRDDDGYTPKLSRYLNRNKEEIREFYNEKKDIMRELIDKGDVYSYVNMHHNTAQLEVVDILYGINKYVSEEDFDIVIHIHFNDHPGRFGKFGKYDGYAIYVPEKQYSNAGASKELAEYISSRLSTYFASSNMPKEADVVESQDLIAVGAYNTVDPISILIEYGYIYERQFQDLEIREIVYEELARQTYNGILDYVGDKKNTLVGYPNLNPQYFDFNHGETGEDVLALQVYLRNKGIYPLNEDLTECPVNGRYGDCTHYAVRKYLDR